MTYPHFFHFDFR